MKKIKAFLFLAKTLNVTFIDEAKESIFPNFEPDHQFISIFEFFFQESLAFLMLFVKMRFS